MLDINTNNGSFSNWDSIYRFMMEECLAEIDVLSVYYCCEPISTHKYTYSVEQIYNMAKGVK